MSFLAKGQRSSAVAAADDAALFSAVAALSIEAVEEVYERHAPALCALALLVTEDSALAKDAVAGAFITLWRSPTSVCLEEQSLRAALAGEVYARCTQTRQTHVAGQRTKIYCAPQPPTRADLTLLSHPQRDLLALIMLGEHNCREAAHRVGLNEAAAARLITGTLRSMHSIEQQPLSPGMDATDPRAGVPTSSVTSSRSRSPRRGKSRGW
jgi:DNA-directed RNA polymerase specialized sigma24 family protein